MCATTYPRKKVKWQNKISRGVGFYVNEIGGQKAKQAAIQKDKTRKCSGKKPIVDSVKLMYRSNVGLVIKTMSGSKLGNGPIRQLQKAPFWLMIDAILIHELMPNSFKKCDETVY
ncbi:unnamed protein product [Camellia sinensis]